MAEGCHVMQMHGGGLGTGSTGGNTGRGGGASNSGRSRGSGGSLVACYKRGTGQLGGLEVLKVPFDELLVAQNLLLTPKPDSHLTEFILVVACTICIFCKVDVKMLRVLSVVVVHHTKQFNGAPIVVEGVELWELEVQLDAKVNKHLLVCVEVSKRFVEKGQSLAGMGGVLHKVEEVEDRTGRTDKVDRGCTTREMKTNDEPEKDSTNVRMLFACHM